MRVSGHPIRQKEKESISIKTAHPIQASGVTISSMAMVIRSGLMAHSTRETMLKESNKAMVHLLGLMAIGMRANSRPTIFKAMVDTLGSMVDTIEAFGRIIKCMVREHSSGLMEDSMKGNTSMKKSKDMESSLGLMAEATLDIGATESKTEKVFTVTKKVRKERVFGVMVKKLSGLTDRLIFSLTTYKLTLILAQTGL